MFMLIYSRIFRLEPCNLILKYVTVLITHYDFTQLPSSNICEVPEASSGVSLTLAFCVKIQIEVYFM